MNKIFYFFLLVTFFSCSNNFISNFKSKINQDILFLNFSLNLKIPENLEKNLKMFSYGTIKIKMKIYNDNKKLVSENNLERIISYDRWNNLYFINDSFQKKEIKYYDFNKLKNELFRFEQIPFKMKKSLDTEKSYIIKYDFYFKSVDFVEPFKFIEYNLNSDNIEKKNNVLYVDKKKISN